MKEVKISDSVLRKAAGEGMDAFVAAFVTAIKEAIGGQLTSETLTELNSDQITLLAWDQLHEEVMDGGFVQLIHNGYGEIVGLARPVEVDIRCSLAVCEVSRATGARLYGRRVHGAV